VARRRQATAQLSIIPTAGLRSAIAGSTCPTPLSTSCGRFRRRPSSRTSTSARSCRISAGGRSNARKLAASLRHAARGRSAICSKSAETRPERHIRMAARHRLDGIVSQFRFSAGGQDAVKPGPAGPPPPAAAGLTAPRPPQPVPPSDHMHYCPSRVPPALIVTFLPARNYDFSIRERHDSAPGRRQTYCMASDNGAVTANLSEIRTVAERPA